MTRQELRKRIENYPPFNEQEERDKTLILDWIQKNENAFLRENEVAHITASAWVVNKDRSRVLMVYHNIYNSCPGWEATRTEKWTCLRLQSERCRRRPGLRT